MRFFVVKRAFAQSATILLSYEHRCVLLRSNAVTGLTNSLSLPPRKFSRLFSIPSVRAFLAPAQKVLRLSTVMIDPWVEAAIRLCFGAKGAFLHG